VPAVLLLKKYGVGKFYNNLKAMGISTLTQNADYYGLSLILGGAEATLWELTECYSNMGRALLNLPNTNITVVKTEQNSNDINKAKYDYNKGAVWQTFEILKQVNRPEEIDWQYIPSIQSIAWKTGTSFGFRDAWSIGVTPRYVVGVWIGNASGEGKAGIIGAQTAAPVMFDLFNMLPKSHWFSAPKNQFIEAEICHTSGHLRGRFCDKIDTLLILPSGEKSAVCPYHNRYYDNTTGEMHSIFTLPPAWERYYKQGGAKLDIYKDFKNLQSPMQFIYPTEKISHITLPKQLDGRKGEITLELAHSLPQTAVFWHIDNDFFTQTKDLHKITTHLTVGKHNITVVDQQGNSESIIIYIDR
jgi:penicillin-binding protein 1C